MGIDNRQSQSALSMLSKPGQAAVRFGELLSQENWAVLGIGLNDLQPLVECYGDAWRDKVLELVAELLLSGQEACGSPNDLLARLKGETFLVITQASSATLWVQKLQKRFGERISSALPPSDIRDGLICPSPTRRLPMPSLAIGVVTARDGPFLTPRDLFNQVKQARSQNERLTLQSNLRSLTVTINRLREETQLAEQAPALLPLIERFARLTTGPIHDLRNGLNILDEEARKVSKILSDPTQGDAIIAATRCSNFLLETCSEIRFRGVGTPHRTDLGELLTKDRPLWIQELDTDVTVRISVPPEPVEIYADRSQIAQVLFNLSSWLVSREEGCTRISIGCRNNVDRGEIVVRGDFDVTMNEDELVKRAITELQSGQRPSLYVLQKLVARYSGRVQFQPREITLDFPRYQWQDIRSADVLVEQIRDLQVQIEELRAYLARILPLNTDQWGEDLSTKEVIGLGSQVIGDLVDGFSLIRQQTERQRRDVGEGGAVLWEPLEAGSHFCQLLAANLLALEGGRVPSPRATDVVSVLAAVWRMLRSKIEGIAEVEWEVEPDIPPVRATEVTLAQVVMNLALNSIEELARVRPPVSRLRFVARRVQDAVQIDISDTGQGLPAEVIEPLFKEPISTRQYVEGGIGLYVVKSILDELGGGIEFRSTVGEGTTASITLPVWDGSQ